MKAECPSIMSRCGRILPCLTTAMDSQDSCGSARLNMALMRRIVGPCNSVWLVTPWALVALAPSAKVVTVSSLLSSAVACRTDLRTPVGSSATR
eukprot:2096012-Amphidinium_carterae.2